MLIRAIETQDEPAVCSLWARVFGYSERRNQPERVLRDKLAWDSQLLVAEVEGGLVGTVMYGYDGHRGWLYSLAVEPSARRAGVAQKLVSEAERRLAALGCIKVNLQIHVHNDIAIQFWQSAGYGEEARVSMGKSLLR